VRDTVLAGAVVGDEYSLILQGLLAGRLLLTILPVGPAGEREQTKNKNNDDDDQDVTLHEIGYPSLHCMTVSYWMEWEAPGLRKLTAELAPSQGLKRLLKKSGIGSELQEFGASGAKAPMILLALCGG
jgi:hypothetical protein